jgi:hypothetical protein
MSRPALSSGLKTADAAILAQSGAVRGLTVTADGTNAATVVLYDNDSAASGTVLAKITVDAGATQECLIPEGGIHAANGIYADVTGTGAEYIVLYDKHW